MIYINKEEQVDFLIESLGNKRHITRWEAVNGLGKLGNKKAIEPLIQTYSNQMEKSIVRAGALYSLAQLGKDDEHIFNVLVKALEDKDYVVRAHAISGLKVLGDNRAIDLLHTALKKEFWRVRWVAASALGRLKSTRSVEPLIEALKDRSRAVRLHSAKALATIGDKRAIKPLLIALEDKEPLVRYRVAQALGMLGDIEALEKLSRLTLYDITPVLQGELVRDAAIYAIAKIKEHNEIKTDQPT